MLSPRHLPTATLLSDWSTSQRLSAPMSQRPSPDWSMHIGFWPIRKLTFLKDWYDYELAKVWVITASVKVVNSRHVESKLKWRKRRVYKSLFLSESPPETNGTNRRDEEKSQKEIINFNFEKKLLSGILFLVFDPSWGMSHACSLKVWKIGTWKVWPWKIHWLGKN